MKRIKSIDERNEGDLYIIHPFSNYDLLDLSVELALEIEGDLPLVLVKLKTKEFKESLESSFQGNKVRVQSVFEIRIRNREIQVQNINGRGIAVYWEQLKNAIESFFEKN